MARAHHLIHKTRLLIQPINQNQNHLHQLLGELMVPKIGVGILDSHRQSNKPLLGTQRGGAYLGPGH